MACIGLVNNFAFKHFMIEDQNIMSLIGSLPPSGASSLSNQEKWNIIQLQYYTKPSYSINSCFFPFHLNVIQNFDRILIRLLSHQHFFPHSSKSV